MIANQIAAEYGQQRESPAFIDPSDEPIFKAAEYDAFYIWVVLHELLGHGTSKLLTEYGADSYNFNRENLPLSPLTGKSITSWYRSGQTWTGVFEDLATSVDECRAECVGAYLMDDPDLLRLFGFNEMKLKPADITYTVYLQITAAGLRALEDYIVEDHKWGQAHSRGHFAMLRCLLAAGENFLVIEKDLTLNYLRIRLDRAKILSHGKPAIGDLLLHLHIYRCTADIHACRDYFETLTRVDGVFEEWRKIVVAQRRPRQILVQANTFIGDDGQVRLKEYSPTVEGMIESWAERCV